MTDCVFCKIVAGEIPAQKVAESTNFIAMLDIAPASIGHTLVIPKKHSTNLLDLPEYTGNELIEFVQRVATAVISATGDDGFNLVLNNGKSAGQVVFHTHFHIIPRKMGDHMPVSIGKHHEVGDLPILREKIASRL